MSASVAAAAGKNARALNVAVQANALNRQKKNEEGRRGWFSGWGTSSMSGILTGAAALFGNIIYQGTVGPWLRYLGIPWYIPLAVGVASSFVPKLIGGLASIWHARNARKENEKIIQRALQQVRQGRLTDAEFAKVRELMMLAQKTDVQLTALAVLIKDNQAGQHTDVQAAELHRLYAVYNNAHKEAAHIVGSKYSDKVAIMKLLNHAKPNTQQEANEKQNLLSELDKMEKLAEYEERKRASGGGGGGKSAASRSSRTTASRTASGGGVGGGGGGGGGAARKQIVAENAIPPQAEQPPLTVAAQPPPVTQRDALMNMIRLQMAALHKQHLLEQAAMSREGLPQEQQMAIIEGQKAEMAALVDKLMFGAQQQQGIQTQQQQQAFLRSQQDFDDMETRAYRQAQDAFQAQQRSPTYTVSPTAAAPMPSVLNQAVANLNLATPNVPPGGAAVAGPSFRHVAPNNHPSSHYYAPPPTMARRPSYYSSLRSGLGSYGDYDDDERAGGDDDDYDDYSEDPYGEDDDDYEPSRRPRRHRKPPALPPREERRKRKPSPRAAKKAPSSGRKRATTATARKTTSTRDRSTSSRKPSVLAAKRRGRR